MVKYAMIKLLGTMEREGKTGNVPGYVMEWYKQTKEGNEDVMQTK